MDSRGVSTAERTHHLHPKLTKTLANTTFNKAFVKVKNGSALGVSVNAVVIRPISILQDFVSVY
jgi:hypothetical protein